MTNKNLKKYLKNYFVFKIFYILRYIIYRYFIKRYTKNFYIINDNIKICIVDNQYDYITFFGYYNLCPQNKNGDIIYLRVKKEEKNLNTPEIAMIMVKTREGEISNIGKTSAWNWQQGCMLQWYMNSNDKIIFNDYDNKKKHYISIIKNIYSGEFKVIDKPVYSVDKLGRFALTLNFERLSLMRPDYGYFNKPINWEDLPSNKEDGIWYIDLCKNSFKLIISLEQLKELKPVDSMINAMHKVNHLDLNPDGSRFMFLHRWISPKGRFMRLISANIDGSEIFILNGDRLISHSCWLDNERILSFCEVNGELGYFLFNDKSNKVRLFSNYFPKVDGHPSISPDGQFIVTDTYPDKSGFSSLFLYDVKKNKIKIIGKFFQPLKYKNEMRIDLHPKWGISSNILFFESGHEQRRKLFQLIIPSNI